MVRFPQLELRVRVRRGDGRIRPVRVAGLRTRSDPFDRHGRVWQWMVDIDEAQPALTDVLASCVGFLVDDDCGRAVGVVEYAMADRVSPGPARLLVVRAWGGQWMAVPLDEVVEVAPGGRRLVVRCRMGHATLVASVGARRWLPADALAWVRPAVNRLAGRIGWPGRP